MIRRVMCWLALIGLLLNSHSTANACGPSYLQPVFVFQGSPDLPFEDFVAGKIGIVRPSFGRKTLVIAYRYLEGGSFSANEQKDLVLALNGSAPEEPTENGIRSWLAARKEYLHEDQLPEIYTERTTPYGGGYNFFPNCAQNAFEVAASTLKDRVTSYGADDPNVREWVRGQDEVFQNCAAGTATIPQELGAEVPAWLRKDRNYQVAAALFYSMQFDEARARFAEIAGDGESDWQATADYLVARTLVRQASLAEDKTKQSALYEQAETRLQKLIATRDQFRIASRKLLGLVRYRTHPEERTGELAELVSHNGASPDLRQDVIDYVWLLDKFEGQVLQAEHERREEAKKKEAEAESFSDQWRRFDTPPDSESRIYLTPRFADGSYDHQHTIYVQVKEDTPEAEVLRLVEQALNRPPTAEEAGDIKTQFRYARDRVKFLASYNRKLSLVSHEYEGCYYCYDIKLKREDLPTFLLANDLTDWIFTLQIDGPQTYAHALAKWRQTDSTAWLVAALVKAEAGSSGLVDLMRAGERLGHPDTPAFPTIMFHLARLKLALGKVAEARQILDQVLDSHSDLLPVSAQNEFRAQRAQVAGNLAEFLKFAPLKPAAFFDEGLFVTIRDLVESRKAWWSDREFEETKEEYEARLENNYKDLLSDDLRLFDENTNEILDRNLSLVLLQQAARDPQVPASLRRHLTLSLWTRAILLDNHEMARQATPAVIERAPEMAALLTKYLEARNAHERERESLYVLLKFPELTPFFTDSIPQLSLYQDLDFDLEGAWWCEPSVTEYRDGKEVPKVVPAPRFLDANQIEVARSEFATLSEIGDAKTFLAKRVLKWAAEAPDDPRIPEALFITFKANAPYKYGCNGWEHNEEIQQEASEILHEQYPQSPWTAKLSQLEKP